MSVQSLGNGVYLSGNTMVQMVSSGSVKIQKGKVIVHSDVKFPDDTQSSDKVMKWGDSKHHPTKINDTIRNTGAIGAGLMTRIAAHFGNGPTLNRVTADNQTEKVYMRNVPAIKEFSKKTNINLLTRNYIVDYEVHKIFFVEYVLSYDFNSIFSAKHVKTSWSLPEFKEDKSFPKYIYINSDWDNPNDSDSVKVRMFTMYDYFEDIQEECRQKNITKFVVAYSAAMLDEYFFPKAFWQSSIRNKWADVAISIPAYKIAMAKNQTHFKYIIYVSPEYFESKYPSTDGSEGWDEFDTEKQEALKKEFTEAIREHMTGVEAGGRSMSAPIYYTADGKEQKAVIIEPIDDKLKDGAYLPDASAANSEILFALQVDPSIIGMGIPGGKNLSGSGSDKREAYTILCASMVFERIVTVLPLIFLKEWNKWDENLEFSFSNVNLTTLDKNPNGQTEITHGTN
ncbi:hypothetical protein [Empedobacter brevis]|uniref:hypothetical protein n=1 Tax=Empedobacter brevis TaxID=247 RepID=UPI0028D4EE01|nr:hypothetical protein [Empedobacter brevis]